MGCGLEGSCFPACAAAIYLRVVHEIPHDLTPAPAVRYATSELNLFSCVVYHPLSDGTPHSSTARHSLDYYRDKGG